MLYNPFEPSNYTQCTERKRRRIEELLVVARVGVAPQVLADQAGILTADALVSQRMMDSASLGIGRAVDVMNAIEEAESKAKLVAGEDRRSKMKILLEQLSSQSGCGVKTGHLEFRSTAEGHSVVTAEALRSRPSLTGKPSSSILIRNLARRENVSMQLIQDVGVECSQFGVVKDVQVKVRPDGPEEEAVRVFVRFDTVATAFKAAEGLNGQMAGDFMLVVCFVPPSLVDSNPLDPQGHEQPVSGFL